MAGSMTAAWTTIPSVLPMPRTSSCTVEMPTSGVGSTAYTPRATSATTLLSTGAHAAGPKFAREFKIAPNSAPIP